MHDAHRATAHNAHGDDGKQKIFRAVTRIDTPYEIQYYQHGGILQYVLRQLIG